MRYGPRRIAGAVVFIASFVALAKASQYAAVAQLGEITGFELASLVGLVPVIVLAFVVDRGRRRARRGGAPVTPIT